ncbi:transmembrane protease serine 3 isoform X2 [Cyprinodon tularosa]|uniref:transmembrane protease serine 3 isoform X2 n=1 Tax=Cyprinodon tularosa TaxID=77115 RepID=UPI0018E1E192|nr:transmembrane protease serine 3 isoform X2 [Cyprinodon tularosa]
MSNATTDIAVNDDNPSTLKTELKTRTPDGENSSNIEVVSVTEEDLSTVDTPDTLFASHDPSLKADFHTEKDPAKPTDPQPPAAPSPTMPVTKVQPFINDNDLNKGWMNRMVTHKLELLIASGVILMVFLALSIGLGVGLSCEGKFRCGSQCVSALARCDGTFDCENHEDELGCARLSGDRSVLQVQKRGEWWTVCSEEWNIQLGISACKQLGYSSHIESSFLPVTSIEQDLQSNLISFNYSQTEVIKLQNATTFTKQQCSSGTVITLKCIACGSTPKYNTRIVGGNTSKPGQFPWQASLHFRSEHLCGGSIIASRWILTAAHCVYGFEDSSLWTVHVGLTEQLIHGAHSLTVKRIVYHAQYQPKGLDYDIALMRLEEPLVFNGLVEPICLPNYGEEFTEGTMCWISGWGATEEDGESSIVLRAARIPLISTKTCNQPEVYKGLISSWMICAGYLEGRIDSCQGDSGGPLACEDATVWKLVGATSWGIGCAERNKPGVYTRITKSLSWIRMQMEGEEVLRSINSDNRKMNIKND